MKPQVVVEHTCVLGEGPVWDTEMSRILWVDIIEGKIHQFSTRTNQHKIFDVGRMIGAIAIREAGGLIAALENGFATVDLENGEVKLISDPESQLPNNRFNDGKCDPAGRFWAGTMDMSGKRNAGGLYVLDGKFEVNEKLKDVSCSNGLAWNSDNNKLYYIDTPTRQVVAFEYDLKTGEIKNEHVVIKFPEDIGLPDGMTIDTEGMLWVAFFDGWQVARWNPETGQQLDKISLPVAKVTSCTFGGEDYRDLYITTASVGLEDGESQDQPLAGSLFVVKDCGYQGTAPFKFKG
jgi:sugar lactone lactonase YvrE